jgi:hypothetical protein
LIVFLGDAMAKRAQKQESEPTPPPPPSRSSALLTAVAIGILLAAMLAGWAEEWLTTGDLITVVGGVLASIRIGPRS